MCGGRGGRGFGSHHSSIPGASSSSEKDSSELISLSLSLPASFAACSVAYFVTYSIRARKQDVALLVLFSLFGWFVKGFLTLHLSCVDLRIPHQKSGSLAVQGIRGVGVHQELGEEDLTNIHKVYKQKKEN